MMSWKDVMTSSQYQNASPEERAEAQNAYFNEKIAPRAGGDQAKLDEARKDFFSAYPLPSTSGKQDGNSADTSGSTSLFQRAENFVTGADRQTDATRQYPLIDAAPEFSGTSQGWSAGLKGLAAHPMENVAMALATSPEQKKNIIKDLFPAAKFEKDEKGNIFATLPSGKYALDRPGITPVDAANTAIAGGELALAAAFPAGLVSELGGGTLATLGADAAAGAVADAGQQGITAAGGGGPVSGTQVAESGLLNIVPGLAGKTVSQVADVLRPTKAASTLVEDVRKLAAKAASTRAAADIVDLAKQTDASGDVLAAAERLGFSPDELNPAHYSENGDMRDLTGKLTTRQGSGLADKEKTLLKKLEDRTQEFITEHGGDTDAGALNSDFKSDLDAVRADLHEQEKELYKQLDAVISPVEPVNATHTLNYLDTLATKRGGGLERLKGAEKTVSDYLGKDGTPTYFGFDELRQDVGRAFGKAEGSRTAEEHQLAQFYHAMRADAKDVADRHGLGDVFELAKRAGESRFALNDVGRAILGKDEMGDLTPRVTSALNKLGKGDLSDWRRLMNVLPDDYRQRAVMTGLGQMFRKGSSAADVLNLPGATNWLRDVKGNSQAWQALTQDLPEQAVQDLDDLHSLFGGVRRGRQSLVADTGNKLGDFEKVMQQAAGGTASRVANAAAKAGKVVKAVAPAVGLHAAGAPGMVLAHGAVKALSSIVERGNKDLLPNLDEIMRSPEFAHLAGMLEEGGHSQQELLRAAAPLEHSSAWKNIRMQLPRQMRVALNIKGLAKVMIDEMHAQQDQQNILHPKADQQQTQQKPSQQVIQQAVQHIQAPDRARADIPAGNARIRDEALYDAITRNTDFPAMRSFVRRRYDEDISHLDGSELQQIQDLWDGLKKQADSAGLPVDTFIKQHRNVAKRIARAMRAVYMH